MANASVLTTKITDQSNIFFVRISRCHVNTFLSFHLSLLSPGWAVESTEEKELVRLLLRFKLLFREEKA